LILQAANKFKWSKIEAIPKNNEKYVSFTLGIYRFLDSFQFMASSLEQLTNNLKNKGIDYFNHSKKYFDENKLDLVTKKGVCSYDYINSFDVFQETRLPPKEAFYSQLRESKIEDSEYERAQAVWNKFECKTLQDYLTLYLKVDVLTQCDVFEAFRDICMKNYGLDPLHYYTAPGLA
jgi:hypothetical protein